MSALSIFSTEALDALSDYFTTTCSIQEKSVTQDSFGEEDESWADVAELDEVFASLAPVFQRHDAERRTTQLTEVPASRFVMLKGAYPQVTPAMRLMITETSEAWNILSCVTDSQTCLTRLMVEQVSL